MNECCVCIKRNTPRVEGGREVGVSRRVTGDSPQGD